MKLHFLIPLLIVSNSFSQEFNFDKIGLYDNIKEIKHYEVVHYSGFNDTSLLNYYFYNEKGDLKEKRFDYRTIQFRRKQAGDTGNQFLYVDTVGTKKKPAFSANFYHYNKEGFLINKIYVNTKPIFLVKEFTTIDPIVSECKKFNNKGLHVSSVVTYQNGDIETRFYEYENKFIKQKRIYRNELFNKTIIYEYKYYFIK